jgi:guanylate cyclase
MQPEEVVGLLDDVFSVFDDLVLERGLEKIKTIGDAYMVASGVPEPRSDHAHVMCDLAVTMMSSIEGSSIRGHAVTFRIGINSGPVVAGVIGKRKFSYDLWGDAVNTASRMESHGSVGKIQITEATKVLVEPDFQCDPAGTVDIKGKGLMPVWHLSRRG